MNIFDMHIAYYRFIKINILGNCAHSIRMSFKRSVQEIRSVYASLRAPFKAISVGCLCLNLVHVIFSYCISDIKPITITAHITRKFMCFVEFVIVLTGLLQNEQYPVCLERHYRHMLTGVKFDTFLVQYRTWHTL